MRKLLVATTMLIGFAGAAHATSLSGMTNAVELGTVLAAERPCNLHFDLTAVQRYIASHVSEDDMSFGSFLQTMVEGRGIEMRSMTPATLAAVCAQTTRVAKFNGFIQ